MHGDGLPALGQGARPLREHLLLEAHGWLVGPVAGMDGLMGRWAFLLCVARKGKRERALVSGKCGWWWGGSFARRRLRARLASQAEEDPNNSKASRLALGGSVFGTKRASSRGPAVPRRGGLNCFCRSVCVFGFCLNAFGDEVCLATADCSSCVGYCNRPARACI